MKEETFKKVYIKTEADLPKGETDSYYAENKDGRKISMFWDAEDKEYSVQVWMRSIVSYLAPIEPEETQGKAELRAAFEAGEAFSDDWGIEFSSEPDKYKPCPNFEEWYVLQPSRSEPDHIPDTGKKVMMTSEEYYGLTTTASLKCQSCNETISGYCDRCQHLLES